MKFPRRSSPRLGGAQLVPGELRWVVMEPALGGSVVAGGLLACPGASTPADFRAPLATLLEEHRAAWSVAIPTRLRTALIPLPPLAEQELQQGIRVQTEKLFRAPDSQLVSDYEIVQPPVTEGGSQSALLVAMPRTTLKVWLDELSRLPRRPLRLEPSFTAFERTVRTLEPPQAPARVTLYGAAGGGGLAIHEGRNPLLVRCLTPPPDLEHPVELFAGEGGIRTLLETLLACEDRHPRLRLEQLRACGSIARGWQHQAAQVAELTLATPPSAPAGTPRDLLAEERWMVPVGCALGGGAG